MNKLFSHLIAELCINLRKFFIMVQISKHECQITPLNTIHQTKEKMLRGVIKHPFWGFLVQNEKKLSEIKSPLE